MQKKGPGVVNTEALRDEVIVKRPSERVRGLGGLRGIPPGEVSAIHNPLRALFVPTAKNFLQNRVDLFVPPQKRPQAI